MTEAFALAGSDFATQWDRYRERANLHLERVFSSLIEKQEGRLIRAMRYSTQNGGKRFRAMLVYASGQCFGAEQSLLDMPACAIELIHAYSLVHDDLPAMDDDDIRRGRPSCHIQFDEATAILAGDALQSLAFERLAASGEGLSAEQRVRMVHLLAHASGVSGMAEGQSLDMISTGEQADRNALQKIHERKTGTLIRAALGLGALAAPGVQEHELEAIDEYGRLIGLAFQVVDDILDETQSSEQLGKQSGADAARDKNTYPALMGLSSSQEYANQLVHSAQQSLGKITGDTDFLYQLAEFTLLRDH